MTDIPLEVTARIYDAGGGRAVTFTWVGTVDNSENGTFLDITPEDLDALLRLQNPRDGDKEVREIFSLWLSRVTWAEGENESRLETLLYSERAASKVGDHAAVDRLRSHLKRLYDVTHFPTNPLSARTFARQKTRNYKAMSRDWRRAGWGLHDADYQNSKPIVKAKPTVEWDGWD